MVAKEIKAMKDNKSPGVDGIPPKLVIETVEQISIELARVFNLSQNEGMVPFAWKEAYIVLVFIKGSCKSIQLVTKRGNGSFCVERSIHRTSIYKGFEK